MTRKGSLNSAFALYLSVHIFDAYRIGIEDGYLVPLYGLGASRADIIMSLVQAERRLSDFNSEDPSFDASTVLDLSIDSLHMQQPMAGMMPQMWPGAMPQGWQPHMQGDPREFESELAAYPYLG